MTTEIDSICIDAGLRPQKFRRCKDVIHLSVKGLAEAGVLIAAAQGGIKRDYACFPKRASRLIVVLRSRFPCGSSDAVAEAARQPHDGRSFLPFTRTA